MNMYYRHSAEIQEPGGQDSRNVGITKDTEKLSNSTDDAFPVAFKDFSDKGLEYMKIVI